MARQARQKSPTGMYNVIMRGNDVLFRDDEDYKRFLDLMNKYIHKIYGFSLTKNLICMVIGESSNGISVDLKPLTTSYARYFNKKYNTDGKLFYGRFKSEPIENEEQLKNSAALASNIADLLGIEGYVSETSDEYEMIPFYASSVQAKSSGSAAKKSVKKESKKTEKAKQSNKKAIPKNKKSSSPKTAEPKNTDTKANHSESAKKQTKPEKNTVQEKQHDIIANTEKKKKKNTLPSWLL